MIIRKRKKLNLPETGVLEQRPFVQEILENNYLLPCMCMVQQIAEQMDTRLWCF